MNRILMFVLAMATLFSGCAAPAAEGVEVREPWIRPAAQGGNSAVYFVIRSSATDELIRVTAAVAEAVEIHESRMDGDVMQMRQLESVPLAAGQEVLFEPGGMHIMLVGLKQDLKAGNEIEITLQFRNYQDLQVRVPVQDNPASDHNH